MQRKTMAMATSKHSNNSVSSSGSGSKEMKAKLSIAIVCMSNVNRSMEAHDLLSKNGFNVSSFGVGDQVRIPGLTIDKPNVYEFGTAYTTIIRDMETQNKWYYTSNGVMGMMERNSRVKTSPERFQNSTEKFDIIVTVNSMVMTAVLNHLKTLTRNGITKRRVAHIINMEVEDSLDSATTASHLILDLLEDICKAKDLNSEINNKIRKFQALRNTTPIGHVLGYY